MGLAAAAAPGGLGSGIKEARCTREKREALEREGESEMLFCLFWEK
jgi:hypothetical protein